MNHENVGVLRCDWAECHHADAAHLEKSSDLQKLQQQKQNSKRSTTTLRSAQAVLFTVVLRFVQAFSIATAECMLFGGDQNPRATSVFASDHCDHPDLVIVTIPKDLTKRLSNTLTCLLSKLCAPRR